MELYSLSSNMFMIASLRITGHYRFVLLEQYAPCQWTCLVQAALTQADEKHEAEKAELQ